MRQAIMLILTIILLGFVFLTTSFIQKKNQEYQNDERWQLIKLKVAKVNTTFFDIIAVCICIAIVYYLFIGESTQMMPIKDVLSYSLYIVMMRYPIEYCALCYYDQSM